jgi:hypothetical protein
VLPRRATFLLLAMLAGAAPPPARGATVDGYLGLLMASGRPAGLAGAYVGLAEGIVGEPFNPAAVAQRDRRLQRGWDWDGALTWYVPSKGDLATVDLNNDGRNERGLSGFGNLMGGLSWQWGRFGAGLVLRSLLFSRQAPDLSTRQVGLTDATLSFAWSGWRDSLVLGAGLAGRSGNYQWVPPGATTAQQLASYGVASFRMGGLWRPRGEAWRLGASLQTGRGVGVTDVVGAVPPGSPDAFEFPWLLSLGGSCWLGPNARRFNEPPLVALAGHPEWGDGPAWEPSAWAPLLLTAQLDLVGRSPGAMSLLSPLDGAAVASGRNLSLVPRAGAEWDWLPDRFRIRGGFYLEPSRTGSTPRSHGTVGLELRVPFWPWDLQLAAGADLANRFHNTSLSVGFWSDLTPPPPRLASAAAPSGR